VDFHGRGTMPVAGPLLTRSAAISSNSSLCLGCSKSTWHSSTPITMGCRPSERQ
jgi:hypothetical protein